MAFSSLTDQLAVLGWSSSVALPGDVKRMMDAIQSEAWPAGAGVAAAEVKSAQALPGFASLQLDPGLPVTVTLSPGFRADITIGGTGVTVPGLIGGTPQTSGAGQSLQRWVQSTGTPVKALLSAVLRLEGAPGAAATMRMLPNGQVPLDPPFVLLPGGTFGLHVPNGLVIGDGIAVEADLFLPRGVPYVGGTVVPVEFALGTPSGVRARTQVDVPANDGRPRIRGVVEWDDPGALSLAACAPTLIDLSAEFDVDGALATPVGDVVVAAGKPLLLRARYARDTRQSASVQHFDVTVLSDGPDGLIRVAVDDGQAGNGAARVFVTGAALATALLADTAASTAPSGDASSAGLVSLLGVAALLRSFCKQGKVVVHGVTVIGTVGTVGTPKLVLELDYSVDILVESIDFAGLSIGMQDDVPMRVRYRKVRLEIDPAGSGLGKFHLSFDQASMDVEDPGRWRVPGAPFDVTGNRAGHGSTWFEIDLRFTLDLGPVKISGATVRATFDGGPMPDVTLRGLDASLAVPGVITGRGKLALAGNGFEASLGVAIVPLNLTAAAYLKLDGQMIVLELAVDLPGAIPLGPTGLGLYSIGGAFGFNALPDLPPPGQDPVEFQLAWTPAQTHFSAGDLMLGFAAVVGTLPDLGFAFSAAGRILLTAPNFTFRAGLDAGFLGPRPRLGGNDQPIGRHAITGVLVYDSSGVVIGVRGTFALKPLLEILVPVDAVFPSASPDWRIHVGSDGANGRTPGPVRVRVLPDLLDLGAEAFLMVHGKDIDNVGDNSSFDLKGFAVAFGAGFHAVFGAGIIWLELAADAQFGIGTSPLVVRGRGHLEGSLHLGPVSIGASADIDAQIGPGDARWAKFSVCGEVDLFFFEISGCVTITIGDEDKSVPDPGTWPLPEVALCDHAYRRTGEAALAGDPPFAWPDVIPVLGFPVLPGPAGFASAQFDKALLLNGKTWKSSYPAVATSTGRTGAEDLTYEFALTGLRLITEDGTPVAGPLEAAWQEPKVSDGAASGGVAGELALLTWHTALWTSRLADGGKSLPNDPLEPEVEHCRVRPQAAGGWALGAPAKPVGDGWRMPPEAGPGDPLVSRFWVDVDVTYRELPVRSTLLGMPSQANYQPGGPIVFSAQLTGGGHDFGGALGVPGLAAPMYWAHELGALFTTLTIVDDEIVPDVLVLLVDDAFAGQVSAGGWAISAFPGTAGHTLLVLTSNAGALVSQIVLQYPVGAHVAILGLHGLSKTARDNAAAAAAAAAAASNDKGLLLGKAKGERRTLLEPGTTYGIEVTLQCQGTRTSNGTAVGTKSFTHDPVVYWFRTPPVPPDPPPPPKGYPVLGHAEPGITKPGNLLKRLLAQDHFDVNSLQRYLLGYTPTDRVANYYPDDPVGAHFSVDHIIALALKYKHRVTLVLQRTDLPPNSSSPPKAIAAVLAELWADAKDKQLVVDQRKLEMAVLSGCPVPHQGGTLGGPAGLVPNATYDLAVQVPKPGADFGIALPGVVFSTSRYRNPREQVAALGFAVPPGGATTGGLPTPALDLTGVPNADRDADSVLAVFLDQLGLGLWEPVASGASTLLWSRPDAGPWRLCGVLLESPEPLERPGRLRLGAVDCMAVPFDVVRRNATGTRVLYLTRTPVVPRRRRVGPITWLPPLLSLTVLEHPTATSPVTPTTPPQTSFVLRAVVPTSPAFAEELS